MFTNVRAARSCYYLQMIRQHVCYQRVTGLFWNFGHFRVFLGLFWLKMGQKWTYSDFFLPNLPKNWFFLKKSMKFDFLMIHNTLE